MNQNSWGTGILVQRQNSSKYSLITSAHVLNREQEFFTIETPDHQKHKASTLVRFDHGKQTGSDLAFLQFNSSNSYQVAVLGEWDQSSKVIAGGFPNNIDLLEQDQTFLCTELGKVFQKLEQPMQDGYQIGSFLGIHNGMSGGPLLNMQGEVIGMNGLAEPAIFNNPDLYLYRNGTRVTESMKLPPERALKLLASSSWSIPSDTIISLSPKQLSLKLNIDN